MTVTVGGPCSQTLWESDERLRVVLAHIQEMVLVVDADGVITYASPSVGRWLGCAPAALIRGTITAIAHPDERAGAAATLERCEPGSPVSLRLRLAAHDGSWRWVDSTIVRLPPDAVDGGVLITCRDVTDRIELERGREQLELDRRVSQRLEAVGQLAAGIAHEINTPLQFVGDSVRFLEEAVDELLRLTGLYRATLYTDDPIPVKDRRRAMCDAEQQANVEYLCQRIPAAFARTADGIARVRSIVQAMKRFSHASWPEVAPADINEAIQTTLAVCRNEYKYVARVVLELGDIPPVTCNIGELNQVFLNLIMNAAQAIEEKVAGTGAQGEIRISTRLEAAEVVITIVDDGPGVPAELQDRIYEPFFTTKEVGRGTGQGLALARSSVLRHAGRLECRSSPGEGAAFTIRLPLTQPLPPAEDAGS